MSDAYLIGMKKMFFFLFGLFVLAIICAIIFSVKTDKVIPGKVDIQLAMDRYVADQYRSATDILEFLGLTPSAPIKIEVLRTECSSMNKDHVSTCAVSLHAQGGDQVFHATLWALHHDATKTTPAGWEVLNVTEQASSVD